ncbi:MAG: DUF948 domain-containing protein [Candidatus Tyrphobacter sp.]
MDWANVLDVGVGIGVLLVGLGVFVAMVALARLFLRMRTTLDEVDRQIAGIGAPIGEALEHVQGISATADETLAKLGGAVGSLEGVAKSLSSTTALVRQAISPAIINIGATLGGVSAGLRRLVTGKSPKDDSEEFVHHGK